MLLPRYSLRTTLLGITSCALLFVVLGQALRGRPWAIVISVAVVSLLVTLLFHAALYLVSSFFSHLVGSQEFSARTSQGGVQSSSDQPSIKQPVLPTNSDSTASI